MLKWTKKSEQIENMTKYGESSKHEENNIAVYNFLPIKQSTNKPTLNSKAQNKLFQRIKIKRTLGVSTESI